jgi:hypothetical protein
VDVSPVVRQPRALAALLLGAVATLGVGGRVASADVGRKVVTLGEGPDGPAIVSGLTSRFGAPYSEGDSSSFRGSLGPAPARSALLDAAVKKRERDADLVARVRHAERKVRADRAILVRTEKTKNKTLVHVWLVDTQGSGGAEVDEDVHVAVGSSIDDEVSAAWSAMAGSFQSTPEPGPSGTPPAAAPPSSSTAAPGAGEASPASSATSASSASPGAGTADVAPDTTPSTPGPRTRAGAFASVALQVVGGSRHFSYVDRLTGTLRPYDLFVAPAVRIAADLYPLSHLNIPVVSGLGVQADYSRAFGLSSEDASGASVGTSWQAFDVGLRDRVALGESFLLGVAGGFGDNAFSFDGAITPAEQLPSVDYKFLRAGIDGRYAGGDLSIRAAFGYRGVLSTGPVGTLFPRATVGGIDATIGVAKMVAPGIEVSVDLDYARFFYSLLPQPGDPYVAGGALDEMASLSVGLAYLL